MAEGQRRRNIYPSGGASFLSALTGSVTEQTQKRREAQQKHQRDIDLLFKSALAGEQVKNQFDPERRAKVQAEQLIQELNPEPSTVPPDVGEPPELQLSSSVSPAIRYLMGKRLETAKEGYANRVQQREAFPQELQAQQDTRRERILQMMQERGLLPSRTANLPVNAYFFDPSTGEVKPSQGGQNLPPRSRILPTRITPEEAGAVAGGREQGKVIGRSDVLPELEEEKQRLSAASARGTQQVKYEDLVKQFSFISKDVDSVLGFLDKIPSGRVAGPGAQLGSVFGMEGSENVLQYTRTKDLILSKIAKTFGGEVGVLTEGDIQRISKGFPAIWMNDQERATSVQWVKDYIQRRIDEYSRTNTQPSGGTSFSTETEAEAANLPPGTRITIGGRPVEVQ